MRRFLFLLSVAVAICAAPVASLAQLSPSAAWASQASKRHRITPNITYLTANSYDLKLDVWQNVEAKSPQPTLVYMHGGGWGTGSKETSTLLFLPYVEAGWNIVNVEYRLSRVSLAPAAVEDCLCALRWVIHNAKQYNIDANRIVVSGNSSGGHLALMLGMAPVSAGLDRQCPGPEELKVAAVVNWYGITDVADLLQGANIRTYAVSWLGSLPNREEVAKRVSPLTYVRPGLPPIISIQGDEDPTVPYQQNVRLHAALDKAGVPNQLVTVHSATHGNFPTAEYIRIYGAIREFLGKHNVWTNSAM